MIVALLCGGLFLGIGLAHYAGYGKPFAFAPILSSYLMLGIAWFGGAVLLTGLGLMITDAGLTLVGMLLLVLSMACFLVALLSFVWLPRRLRPAWLREWIDRGRRPEEAGLWPRWSRRQVR